MNSSTQMNAGYYQSMDRDQEPITQNSNWMEKGASGGGSGGGKKSKWLVSGV